MAELYPAPLENLLRRLSRELAAQDTLFDLKSKSFYRGDARVDTSIRFLGREAATPVGPAAGPQSQLAQNIVLSWLAGSRIIELKTVQINDRLQIPRPCIFAGNIGFNVEWSQELRLAESLREYVKASMILDILRDCRLAGERPGREKDATVFDMSVGYDLAGIRSPQVTGWIQSMMDAGPIIDSLRPSLSEDFARYRDFPFRTRIADTITLSTFHGCPADEIEKIVLYLVTELGIDTVIKLNPTLLGKGRVDHILHEILGYSELTSTEDAFEKDLQFADALAMVRRLVDTGKRQGRQVGVKFTNTLVVQNHQKYFSDPVMYLSGPPLHVISLTLAEVFRQALGFELPVSFSAGIDRHNFTNAVACGFTPITTCTDLLKTGGYGRLPGYLTELEQKMKELGVRSVGDYIVKSEGQAAPVMKRALGELREAARTVRPTALADQAVRIVDDLELDLTANLASDQVDLAHQTYVAHRAFEAALGAAYETGPLKASVQGLHESLVRATALANMTPIVQRTQADPRYRKQQNNVLPRKLGSKLYLFDCVNCDKCVPVCPNDANFSYEIAAMEVRYADVEMGPGGPRDVGELTFKVAKAHQLANFSDFCNECGNCDTFCPEDGGPYVVKPRFFGSLEAWRRHSDHDGFHIARLDGGRYRVYGRIEGTAFTLDADPASDTAVFSDSRLELSLRYRFGTVTARSAAPATPAGHRLDVSRFFIMKSLLDGVLSSGRVNYVNAGFAGGAQGRETCPT